MANVPERLCFCGQQAQHEAKVGGRFSAYCCACFDHDWPEQRLVEGQECLKERVEIVPKPPPPYHVWRWKAGVQPEGTTTRE